MGKKKLEFTEYQQNYLLPNVVYIDTQKMGDKTTVALLKLKNGFEVVGTSACVNPAHFDIEMGIHYATVDALTKLDQFIGFAKNQEDYERSIAVDHASWNNYRDSAGT